MIHTSSVAPKAILITGMHRSGTSALARIVNLHGAHIGSRLLEPTEDNASGYWENWHVVMFHERVLCALGMAWDSAQGVPESWATTEQFAGYVDELCALIRSEFGDEPLWMVKDPRLCRLLPLWTAALDRLGIEPNFVFEVRHPEEVIGSLIKRDDLGAGLASLLWIDYLREPVMATQDAKRAMLIYDDVLADWKPGIQRVGQLLSIEWPVSSDACAAAVDTHIDPTMRHHRAESSDLIPAVWRQSILDVFQACRMASESVDGWDKLQASMALAKQVIDSVAVISGDLPSPSQLASRDAELASNSVELARQAAEIQQATIDLAAMHSTLASREKALNEALLESGELSRNLDAVRSLVADLESEAYFRRRELAEMGVAQDLAQQRNEWLSAELHGARQQIDEMVRSHSWRITRPLRLLMRLGRGDLGYVRQALWQWRTRRAEAAAAADAVREQANVLPQVDPAELVRQLKFAQVPSPAFSVRVLGGDNFAATCRTLQSLQTQSGDVGFEVSVQAGGMSDSERGELSRIAGLHVLDGAEDVGEPAAAPYAFVVKAGVLTADGCLKSLAETFARIPDAWMVGPKALDGAGRVREAGTIVWRDGSSMAYGEGWSADRHECNYLKDVDACGDAAFALNLDVVRKAQLPLTGLDSRLSCIELSFRLRELGGRVLFQPKAVVFDERAGPAAATPRLPASWKSVLERDQLGAASGPLQARDRSQLKNVLLMVDHSVPQPDRDAGSRTMWQLIQMFMRHGMIVKFWPHEPNPDPRYVALLTQEGVEVVTQHDGGFNAWLIEHGASLQSVLLSRPHVALEYLYAVRKLSRARVLYYGHDIHYARLQAQFEHQPSAELEQQMARHMAWEHALWPSADAVYYPADGETTIVREWLAQRGYAHEAVRTIPAYAFDSFPEAPHAHLAKRNGMMFVGGFAHAPNADAAIWFAREVMPAVLARRPDAHLYLLGSNPSPEVFALASANITVVGFVSDEELERYYHDVRLAVAPLRFGAGLKGKVVEAMRFGVPCVTTSVGAQGLEDVGFLAVADHPQDFADRVVELLGDDVLWQATSAASQQLARDRYSVDAPWRIIGPDLQLTK